MFYDKIGRGGRKEMRVMPAYHKREIVLYVPSLAPGNVY